MKLPKSYFVRRWVEVVFPVLFLIFYGIGIIPLWVFIGILMLLIHIMDIFTGLEKLIGWQNFVLLIFIVGGSTEMPHGWWEGLIWGLEIIFIYYMIRSYILIFFKSARKGDEEYYKQTLIERAGSGDFEAANELFKDLK